MKPLQWVILAVCVVILLGIVMMRFSGGPPDPDAMAAQALKGGTAKEKAQAATQLTMLKGKKVVPLLRKLAGESQEPDVLIVALNGLVAAEDTESFPLLYKSMNHAEKKVREVAWAGVKTMNAGAPLPGGLQYQVDDTADTRAQVVNRLQQLYEDREKDKGAKD